MRIVPTVGIRIRIILSYSTGDKDDAGGDEAWKQG